MRTILVVDDDTMITASVARFFRKSGFSVFLAHSVREAKNLLGSHSFDALLTDFNLGDGTGVDVLEVTPRTTKAALWSGSEGDARRAAEMAGVERPVFGKPLSLDLIREALQG